MDKFKKLLEIADRLNGPNGCPWDIKQTFESLQPYILEEAHELIEAVDEADDPHIVEELGDLLYTIIFYCKIAEKGSRFKTEDVIEHISEKLIRRHPHVFGETEVNNADDVVKNWEKIKHKEKGDKRKSALDGIPPTLPILAKAQKVLEKIKRKSEMLPDSADSTYSENEIGEQFIELIQKSMHSKVDCESALRRALGRYEEKFRKFEQGV